MEAALAAQGRAIHIANRKSVAPVGPAPKQSTPLPTSPLRGEVKASHNPVVAAVDVSPKTLALSGDNKDLLLRLHREMQLIRRFEERTQEQYTKAKIGGYCHLNIGEEATVVGGITALKPNDYIFTSYREHGHAIARGVDPKAVMAELFGKETGTTMVNAFTLVQVMRYSMPLTVMVLASTGASPVMMTRLLLLTTVLVLVSLNLGASSRLTVLFMMPARALAM